MVNQKAIVVGTGFVGATTAYALSIKEIVPEVVLIDINEELAEAQEMDISHGNAYSSTTKIRRGNYSDINENDVVIITSGIGELKPGQTRLDLIEINLKILRSVLSEIKNQNKEVYIIIVANPVDILTYFAIKEMEFAPGKVFGSGTVLDSIRFRDILSKDLQINPKDIDGYILGEHGDSSFPAFSNLHVGGVPIENLINFDQEYQNKITQMVRDSAYKIIAGKKATYYGIGSVVSDIVKAIIRDEKRVMAVSIITNGEFGISDVCVGLPTVIGKGGAERILEMKLNTAEIEQLNKSVSTLKDIIIKNS